MKGIVVPIVTNGEKKMVEEYRGVTLAQTAYKVYTAVLAEILRDEMEGKKILPNQTRFRTGMGTTNNIYVLKYLINRQMERGKEGMVIMIIMVMLVHIKAAFDSVDRRKVVRNRYFQ